VRGKEGVAKTAVERVERYREHVVNYNVERRSVQSCRHDTR